MNRAAVSFLLPILLFLAACAKNSNAEFTQKGTAKPDNSAATAASSIEGGSISGTTYKNPAFGITFQIPAGLVPASFDSLRALNDSLESSTRTIMLPPDAVKKTGSPHPIPPKYIFYASKKGEWDGRQTNIPSVFVSVRPTRTRSLDTETFEQTANNAAIVSDMKMLGSPSTFMVNKHAFFRADFEHGIGALQAFQSLIQTMIGDNLLEVKINGYSLEELQQTAHFLQTISITQN